MALKIKRRTEQEDKPNSNCSESIRVPPKLTDFLKEYDRTESISGKNLLLAANYREIFHADMPEGIPLELIKTKIAYKILAEYYEAAGVSMPEKTRINFQAAQAFDIEKMAPGMRSLMQITMKEKQEEEVAISKNGSKSKTKSKTAAQTGVAHLYVEIFNAQPTKQLTDTEIAELIKSKTGNLPSPKAIANFRCYYNAGRLSGQKGKPKEKIKSYRPKKNKKVSKTPSNKKLVLKKKK